MSSVEVPADKLMPEACRTLHHGDWVQCDECNVYLIWDRIPDENILTYNEYHGDRYQRPEVIVTGFICPICTAKNEF